MTITQIQEDGSCSHHRLKEMVRLSENETPRIRRPFAEAIDRTIAALKSFAAVYKDLPNLTIGRGDRRNAKGQQPKEISQTR